ncbi:hypothetical protein [Nocardioides dilutus]
MTAYSGLSQLLEDTARTSVDDHQPGLDGLALDQRKVSRVQKALSSVDRYLFAHTRLTELIHDYVRASNDDATNFDYARGALKLQRIIETPPARYRRMEDGFEPID